MDSPEFCGSCHSVMDPEYTAYTALAARARALRRVPHRPGASWFVKSKLSGSWQLVSVTSTSTRARSPRRSTNLRPARDTCEQCHWPTSSSATGSGS